MRRVDGDEGFSLLEVLFASFIAFFILTALFSVIVASSGQGRIAKADSIASQLAQLVVEQARSLPYESIGTTSPPAGQPVGVLASKEETTYQSYKFTVSRAVTWVNDPSNDSGGGDVTHDYKMLTVQVYWEGGHTTPLYTYIREKSNDMPTPPVVMWYQYPPPNAVLFTLNGATRVWDGSTDPSGTTSDIAALQATASIDASLGTVVRVEFWSGTRMFMAGNGNALNVIAPSLAWPCSSYGLPYTGPYPINLKATDASGAALFPEGKNTLRLVAYSSGMAYGYQLLSFTVDNTAAVFPAGSLVGISVPSDNTDRYNGCIVATWTAPLDGLDPTSRYDLEIRRSGESTAPYESLNLGSEGKVLLGGGMPSGWTPVPFSAYKVALYPRSIRGLLGRTYASSAFSANCPQLTGVIFNQASNNKSKANYRFDLTVSLPQDGLAALFGGSSIVYDVFYRDGDTYVYPGYGDLENPSAGPVDQPGPTFQVQASTVYNRYLQVVAKVRSFDGSVVATIPSNVVGPATTVPGHMETAVLTIP